MIRRCGAGLSTATAALLTLYETCVERDGDPPCVTAPGGACRERLDDRHAPLARQAVKPAINLAGRAFGRLTVIAREARVSGVHVRPRWRCRCSCGSETVVRAASLLAGRTRSCGCLRAELARASVVVARAQRARNLLMTFPGIAAEVHRPSMPLKTSGARSTCVRGVQGAGRSDA